MNTEIRNPSGEKLDYSYLAGSEKPAAWIIILGHGVTGNKDRPLIAETAAALNQAGYTTLAFSFSGNGDSEGKFVDSNITKGVQDLLSVINAVGDKNIVYIGHSMGAASGVLAAGQDPRIKRLVSLAGMVNTKAFATVEFGEETPDSGFMWEDDDCPLSQSFMDDLCMTVGSVLEEADNVKVPWLLLHGTEDDVVSPRDSDDICKRLGDRVQLVRISGADHSFNDDNRQAQVDAVLNWLNTQCSE